VPGEPGYFHARTRHSWWNSRVSFPSKCHSIVHSEISKTPRWLFGPLEDDQWGELRLDLKNLSEKFSIWFFHSEFFGSKREFMPPINWILFGFQVIMIQPGFVHGHQSRQTENHLDSDEKFSNLIRLLAKFTFYSSFKHYCTHFPLISHEQIFMNYEPKPVKWDAHLLAYWFKRNLVVFKD